MLCLKAGTPFKVGSCFKFQPYRNSLVLRVKNPLFDMMKISRNIYE